MFLSMIVQYSYTDAVLLHRVKWVHKLQQQQQPEETIDQNDVDEEFPLHFLWKFDKNHWKNIK